MSKLLFKLEYTVRELRIPAEVVLPFDYGGPHEVKVVLRAPSDEEQAIGHNISHAFCTASSAVEPSEKVREVFAKIAAKFVCQECIRRACRFRSSYNICAPLARE
jgi:hypothetical protein